MKILITGASGYIGGALLNRLRGLRPIGVRFQSPTGDGDPDMFSADLRDEEAVRRLFDANRPDVLFHLAGLVSPDENEKRPQAATEAHLHITANVLKHAGDATHVVFPSTDKVFDGTAPDPDEEAPASPQFLYGKLKLECERRVINRTKRHHIFRLPIVHGLGDPRSHSFVDKAFIALEAGETVNAFQNVQRCFVKLNELVEVLERTLENNRYGIYHVGSPMMSYFDRIRVLCDEKHIPWRDRLIPKVGQASPLAQNLNTRKIKEVFGWSFS